MAHEIKIKNRNGLHRVIVTKNGITVKEKFFEDEGEMYVYFRRVHRILHKSRIYE